MNEEVGDDNEDDASQADNTGSAEECQEALINDAGHLILSNPPFCEDDGESREQRRCKWQMQVSSMEILLPTHRRGVS